jgi:cytochrome c-type biogenesis protein CcsB
MASLEIAMLTAALAGLGLSLVIILLRPVLGKRLSDYLALATAVMSFIFLTISIIARAILTGHGPFSNMLEFSLSFSWGIMVVGFFFWWRYRLLLLNAISIVIALGLLIFAHTLPSRSAPLVPALQQSLLLTTHVASAVISYGAFTIGFSAALIYLIRFNRKGLRDSEKDLLDGISYQAVIVGFPFMTLVIILGALWADIVWGRYWSWDPKETSSLVTWLLYASYLHARVIRGWRGQKAASLLIIGFVAVIVTFFGNYLFTGLHSYR